jgi:hypothetical protein
MLRVSLLVPGNAPTGGKGEAEAEAECDAEAHEIADAERNAEAHEMAEVEAANAQAGGGLETLDNDKAAMQQGRLGLGNFCKLKHIANSKIWSLN